jgi:signal transduction histidine kinase
MLSSRLRRLRGRLSFQLTAWYSAFFILSVLVLFGLAYLLLASSLRQRDREAIHLKLGELVTQYQAEGAAGLRADLRARAGLPRAKPFFLRLASPTGTTLFLEVPDQWAGFDLRSLERQGVGSTGGWTVVPVEGDETQLEVEAARLPDGSVLQVGRSTEDRDGLLERFREVVVGVMTVVLVLAFAGGGLLSLRALRPIRGLIRTVRAIEAGAMDSRVATHGTGDELDELSTLFNQMLDRIETLIQGMRGALDNVAHDLRTPMTRLRGIAELALQAEGDLPACREALGECLEEASRVLAMLNTLMDISEAETGAMQLRPEAVGLASLIGDAAELYGYLAEEKGLTLTSSVPKDLRLTADPSRLQQVLANLLDNAIKYTPAGGRVELVAYREADDVVLVVEDTGIGIAPEDLPKIWERLYRGDRSRSQRGLGLGLSLVRAVVRAHGGSVEATSDPGAGSRFTLRFPSHRAAAR